MYIYVYIYIYIYISYIRDSQHFLKNIKTIGSVLENVKVNLNEHKLANVRKGIMNKKRFTDFGLREIKKKVIGDVKDIDSGNVDIIGCGYY